VESAFVGTGLAARPVAPKLVGNGGAGGRIGLVGWIVPSTASPLAVYWFVSSAFIAAFARGGDDDFSPGFFPRRFSEQKVRGRASHRHLCHWKVPATGLLEFSPAPMTAKTTGPY